jgi:predicted O-linked N-acetylglucosamine transferase (SPINDLY family)
MPSPRVVSLLQQALAHLQGGQADKAAALCQQARALEPGNFDALHILGAIALQKGRPKEAIPLLSLARKIAPRHAQCTLRLAQAHIACAEFPRAAQLLRAALQADPGTADYWTHLATVLKYQGQAKEAVEACRKAVELRPDFAEAYDQLGGLVAETEGHLAAEPHFRKAAELNPADPRPCCNLGICLSYRKEVDEALHCFQRAIELDPRMAKAHAGLGLALEREYRLEEAVVSLRRALELDPQAHDARSCLLLNLHYLPHYNRDQVFAEHLAFGRSLPPAAAPLPGPATEGRRLRIGFLSPDLKAHSVAYFIAPLLKGLDPSRFELFLYHDHAKLDWMSDFLRDLVPNWRHVAGMPAETLVTRIRADRLDLLVDLAGHTAFNRLPLFNQRLAPVQATYLGYPDTTGVPAMDYRLSDGIADPEGEADAYCTETLLRFSSCAWCYTPPPATPEVQEAPCLKVGAGITFGCFNNFAKITDDSLAAWGRLLAAVPDSRLLLKNHGLGNPATQARIRERFDKVGLPADRVELLGRTERVEDHLACYHRVDIALDSFPYHGTTTTCEALLMGVPVLTLKGDRHASRVSASLLQCIGHPEWVAQEWDQFMNIATKLASDRLALGDVRRRLRSELIESQVCKHADQARLFGNALEGMIRLGPKPLPQTCA